MQGSAPHSEERLRARYASIPVPGHRVPTPRWTLGLLATSVACGVVGSVTGVVPLSMALLIASTACAAGALVIYLIETRRPRLGRLR